jgi:hypothetical protein
MTTWERSVFRPVAIAAMAGCVALALVELVGMVADEWSGGYLVVACMVAALEACYSYRMIEHRRLRGADALRFRAIEIALLLVLVKVGSYAGSNWHVVATELRSWPTQPRSIIDVSDVMGAAVVLIGWMSATSTMRDLDRIAEPLALRRDSARFVRSVTGRFFWGGAVLMIAAGLTRVGISDLLELERPQVPRLVANVLAYFLLGLAMLGQMHLAQLRKQWQSQGIAGSEDVTRRWVRYSAILIGLAVLLAVIIPIGYAGGILETGATVVNAVLYVVAMAAWLLSSLISLVIWLVSGLFESILGKGEQGQPQLDPLPRRSALPRVVMPLVIPAWLEILRTAVFWAATVALVGYVLRSYLRDHPEILDALRRLHIVTALRALVAQLRRRFVAAVDAVRRLSSADADRQDASRTIRIPRLASRSPRERIVYYYLSTVRRASRLGIPRVRYQTPREYYAVLGPRVPESRPELASLTEAFLEARYSRHDIDRDGGKQAEEEWRAVRRALSALRRERNRAEQA